MAVTITGVEGGSVAETCGIESGHRLLRIDGHEIEDILDYRFYSTEPNLYLDLADENGKPYSKAVRKSRYGDVGLLFDTYLMDKQRSCKNKCVFCFIDQLPPGLRESLYFKDDDSRMSFLFGNYITLTNLRPRDVERIIEMHISPINISVHTTNPHLRVEMMKNPHSGEALRYLPMLAEAGIRINAQLVLCPGINDGLELERSLGDLTAYAPGLQSVSVVPVGLTKFRDGLSPLRLFTKAEAAGVVQTVEAFGQRMKETHGVRICYAADEFYLASGTPVPPAEFYEEFAQLENGVGLLALLEDEFAGALVDEESQSLQRKVTIATGVAAYPFIQSMGCRATNRYPGLQVETVPIRNDFFGNDITVAGLVTGTDLIEQLKGRDLGQQLLLPAVMLRHERDLFLDSVSVEQVEQALGCSVRLVENDGRDLLDAMMGTQYN